MKAKKNTILLVEDEAIIAITQKLAMEKFGYNVITASTGEKAIEIFNNNKDIDLILLDIDLGKGIDGAETAEIILKNHNVPIVFLSSHTEPEYIHKMEKITSYGYVVKNSMGIVFDASIKMAFKLFDAHEKVKNELAERKIAEETLLKSENRYRVLIDLAVDGIMLGSNEGIITDANQCMCEILRMKREDFVGKHVSLLPFTKESIEKNPLRFDLLQKGETVISERSLIRPDGSIATIEMRSKIMPDGSYQSIYRDISDRKHAEEKLRESEEKFRNLFENMNDAFALHKIILNDKGDPVDYQFLEVNPVFTKRLGMESKDIINRTALELFPKTEQSWIDIFGKVAITGQSINYSSYSIELDKHFETNIYCPRPGYFAVLFTDVTDRKNAEQEKHLLEERLQRSEKMEALGLLAGGVAHDLNNVLGGIVGFAELSLLDIEKTNPIRSNLENIMKSGLRAAEIVQDLLTMARRGVSGRKVINLNKIISDFEHLPEYEKLYSYNSLIKIKTILEPDLLNISGSAVHLGKTIYNLVLNAVEATVNHGEVTIQTCNKYLEKPVHGYADIKEGDYVVVTVSDTGEGIPESDLKHIFEPFYTKKFMGRSGTGLGLSIVWGTVKDHNGYINVQSEKDKGTSFILYFPVTRDEIEDDDLSLSISEYTGNGETILIIDDVKEQRELAAAMLKRLEYNVETVSSGEEAVEYLKNNKADLLVLDMIMEPGMDGLDTYKNILKIHPKQKVIISSGYSESDRVNDARNLGAGAYVKKPYVLEKLGMAVKKELEK